MDKTVEARVFSVMRKSALPSVEALCLPSLTARSLQERACGSGSFNRVVSGTAVQGID